ncbi:hypothetical protein AU255_11525 [Methyloprofundus sedimenti]|uniref:Type II secretion system protein GspB C-terminal domain-containing protein n=1 Tax=Methyloprofundus sedimenti TaxID=1420851 RepID=A0A1V8M9Y3_9GAMM|nr:general secretion pathway protein GspB [Methyloprofundus sedimenti]OQK18414.1 hypothetical protein AU255_11525 [Methyloprofundus sedimenti]
MSFILNALRKSEQERLSNHADTLEDKILLQQVANRRKRPDFLMILIIINFLLLAFFIGYFILQEQRSNNKKPVKASAQVNTPAQIKKAQPVLVQAAKLNTTPEFTIAQQVNSHQAKKQKNSKPQTSSKIKQIIKPAALVKQPQPKKVMKNITERKPVIQKPDLIERSRENDPPYLSDMPYDFRLSVPKLNINAFVYTEHPENRFIIVGMRKYQIGQKINDEMELQEIRPDSIVVEYQDKVFQIHR